MLKGDLGELRCDGSKTLQPVYWNRKVTGKDVDIGNGVELTLRPLEKL